MKACPQCQHGNIETAKHCVECGQKLPPPPASSVIPAVSAKPCSYCGRSNPSARVTCHECGSDLPQVANLPAKEAPLEASAVTETSSVDGVTPEASWQPVEVPHLVGGSVTLLHKGLLRYQDEDPFDIKDAKTCGASFGIEVVQDAQILSIPVGTDKREMVKYQEEIGWFVEEQPKAAPAPPQAPAVVEPTKESTHYPCELHKVDPAPTTSSDGRPFPGIPPEWPQLPWSRDWHLHYDPNRAFQPQNALTPIDSGPIAIRRVETLVEAAHRIVNGVRELNIPRSTLAWSEIIFPSETRFILVHVVQIWDESESEAKVTSWIEYKAVGNVPSASVRTSLETWRPHPDESKRRLRRSIRNLIPLLGIALLPVVFCVWFWMNLRAEYTGPVDFELKNLDRIVSQIRPFLKDRALYYEPTPNQWFARHMSDSTVELMSKYTGEPITSNLLRASLTAELRGHITGPFIGEVDPEFWHSTANYPAGDQARQLVKKHQKERLTGASLERLNYLVLRAALPVLTDQTPGTGEPPGWLLHVFTVALLALGLMAFVILAAIWECFQCQGRDAPRHRIPARSHYDVVHTAVSQVVGR